MPRKKNYKASAARTSQAVKADPAATQAVPSPDDARIDMVALLGPEARFPQDKRVLDLREWLGRGIDMWVCSVGFCLKTILLSGARETATVTAYFTNVGYLFEYLTGGEQTLAAARPQTPTDMSPLTVQHFIGWLKKRAQAEGWRPSSARSAYNHVKAVVVALLDQGIIRGDRSRFFPRGAISWRGEEGLQTSLSDAEQERLARAIKSDLVAIHHKRLTLNQGTVQGLRLLVVAHRQGFNPTPLLEMRRDALAPGFLPGTVRIRTAKYRNRKIRSSAGRAAKSAKPSEQDLVFDLSEGAVLQQAIASTSDLVEAASPAHKQRIWLYRANATNGPTHSGSVICLNKKSLNATIEGVISRHKLLGDDGKPLRVNLSRLRKSRFDRALRVSDGDLAVTANLMGNTPKVAGINYPSMNHSRQAEAAGFMNGDYIAMMQAGHADGARVEIRSVEVRPHKATTEDSPQTLPTQTPIASCKDTINGEHSPHDGESHCDRYVMCLFCSSFAVVGTVEELWRLFSFQAFAKSELGYLDEKLGAERTADQTLEDLRDRYRMVIPYIDDFTQQQFAPSRVAQARTKTAAGLHPYWQHQMTMSRRAQSRGPEGLQGSSGTVDDSGIGGRFGT
jgi:hypothetical protein